MPAGPLSAAVAHLGRTVRPPDPRPDAALVAAFTRTRDETAAAELVRRHGPMVYGVCRRLHAAEADDAFQAVWLVFSRKAAQVKPPGAVAAWLHGVAVKVAAKARSQSLTRRHRLMATARPEPVFDPPTDPLLSAVLDEELALLPEKLRRAVLLCDLGGKTRVEAAAELGWPEGTVATRLAAGREKLAARLRRRGVTLPAVGLAAVLAPAATAAPVPAALDFAAVNLLLGTAAAPPAALPLADAVRHPMTPTTGKLAALGLLAAVGLTAGGIGLAPKMEAGPESVPAGWVLKAVLKDHSQLVTMAEFDRKGKRFATADVNGGVIVWDTATLKPVSRMSVPSPLPPADDRFGLVRVPQPVGVGRTPGNLPSPLVLSFPFDNVLSVLHRPDAANQAVRTRFDPANGKAIDSGPFTPRFIAAAPDGRQLVAAGQVLQVRPVGGGTPLALDTGGPAEVSARGAVWGPDHKTLAVIGHNDSAGGSVWVFDSFTGQRLKVLRVVGQTAQTLVFAADGRSLAAGLGSTAVVWDTATWAERFRADAPAGERLGTLAFTPDGTQLLAAGWGAVHGWDATTGKSLAPLPVEGDAGLSDIAVSPDGGTLVAAVGRGVRGDTARPADKLRAAADKGEVRVYVRAEVADPTPTNEWQLQAVSREHGQMVYDAAFSPDGKSFATAGADGQVFVWDTATRAVRFRTKVTQKLSLTAPELPPAAGGIALPPPAIPGAGGNPPALGVRFQGADGLVVWTTADGTGETYLDPADGKTQLVVRKAEVPLAVGGGKGVFRADNGHVVRNLPLDFDSSVRLDVPRPDGSGKGFAGWMAWAVSADGKRVALSEWHIEGVSKLRVLDAATGKTVSVTPLGGADDSVFTRLAFSPDGKRLACGSQAGRLAVFGGDDWKEAYRIAEPLTRWVDGVAFTPDGTQLLVTGYRVVHRKGWFGVLVSNTVHRELWVRDAATGTLVQSLPLAEPRAVTATANGFGLDVGRLAVSPDGRTVVVTLGSPNRGRPVETAAEQAEKAAAGEVRIYTRGERRAATPPAAKPAQDSGGWRLRPAVEDRSPLRSVAFSRDGRLIATGHAGPGVTLRRADTLRVAKTLTVGGEAPRTDVSFGPDGTWLVATKRDGVSYHWTADRAGGPEPPEWSNALIRPFNPAAVAVNPDGTRLALSDGQQIAVVDILTRHTVLFGPLDGSGPGPAAVSWAPDGKQLVFLPNAPTDAKVDSRQNARTFSMLDRNGKGKAVPLPHGKDRLTAAAWAGDRIFTADEGGTVVVWDAATFAVRKRLKLAAPVSALAVTPDGRRFAAAVAGRIEVYAARQADDWNGPDALPVTAAVHGLAFAPDGNTLAAGTDAGLVVWERATP